jgi:hypothetical protein
VQVFENVWSQGAPFYYRGLGIFHVHCDFGVPHGHCGFVFLSPWSCVFHACHGFVFIMIGEVLGVFFDHYGLVFLVVTMFLRFS